MIKKPDFLIRYLPRNKIAAYGVLIEVSEEFIEFAKQQKLDKGGYERLAFEMIQASGWPHLDYENHYRGRSICNWEEGGLIHHVVVPGNASGVVLEEYSEGETGWAYLPHNMDSVSQASAILGIMSYYWFDLQLRIPKF